MRRLHGSSGDGLSGDRPADRADGEEDKDGGQVSAAKRARTGAPSADDLARASQFYSMAVAHEADAKMDAAISEYRAAAELGLADACYALGVAYANGEGVDMDQKLAVEWYERANQKNCPHATSALGCRYWFGSYGTPCEPMRAMCYFAVADDRLCSDLCRSQPHGRPCQSMRGFQTYDVWVGVTTEYARGLWLGLNRDVKLCATDIGKARRIINAACLDRSYASTHYVRAGTAVCGDGADLSQAAALLALAEKGLTNRQLYGAGDAIARAKARAALCVLAGTNYSGSDAETRLCFGRFRRSNRASVVSAFITCDVAALARIPPPLVRLIASYLSGLGDFIEADEYFEFANRYGLAPEMRVDLLRRAAELGSSHAQNELGCMLHDGYGGVAGNPAAALRWHMAAGDQGIDISALSAATVFLEQTPPDMLAACTWLCKAWKLGNAQAMYQLSGILMEGLGGCPRDMDRGLRLLRWAADSGHVCAQAHLGNVLEIGHGLAAPDLQEAAFQYNMAGYHGSSREIAIGLYNVAELVLLYGLGGTADEHIPDDRRAAAAVALWRRGSGMNEGHCCYRLGWAHATGTLGCRVDAAEAFQWFERASTLGHYGAKCHLAARQDAPGAPCFFSGYHYGVDAECSDAPIIGPLLGRSRSEAAARLGVDLLNGREFVWSALEAPRLPDPDTASSRGVVALAS